jgi:hypothetical protein
MTPNRRQRQTTRNAGRAFPRRPSQQRPERTTILLVCEGRETEPNYFDGLKREDDVAKKFTITVQRGKGGSRLQIVQEAIDARKRKQSKFDEVWCVMDVEYPDSPDAQRDLTDAMALAKDKGIQAYLSNPSFEIWFLAHFKRTSRSFIDADAVIVELDSHWRAAFSQDYQKNDRDVYDKLAARTAQAIQNARNVLETDHGENARCINSNSSTEVYKLVGRLCGS